MSVEKTLQAIKMYRKGYSCIDIAQSIGLSYECVVDLIEHPETMKSAIDTAKMGERIRGMNGDYSLFDMSLMLKVSERTILKIASACGFEVLRARNHSDRTAPVFVQADKMTDDEFRDYMLGDDDILKKIKSRRATPKVLNTPLGYIRFNDYMEQYPRVIASKVKNEIDSQIPDLLFMDNSYFHNYPVSFLDTLSRFFSEICLIRDSVDVLYNERHDLEDKLEKETDEEKKTVIRKKIRVIVKESSAKMRTVFDLYNKIYDEISKQKGSI